MSASRYIALLRAINVGGRTVRMEELRKLFAAMGFADSETFIASGNVIFESPARSSAEIEQQIEKGLETSLGYEVATFVRSPAELAAIAAHEPFARDELDRPGAALYIGFLRDAPGDDARQKLLALRSRIDDFHLHGRELYWLARERMSESKVSNAVLERILASRTTLRNINTVRKLAAKYPAER